LTNQFRALDDDEIEFLDSVQQSTRAKEAKVKKDTKEQLDAFRRQQEEIEKAAKQAESADAPVLTESWVASGSRKRKKGKEKEGLAGVKVRRTSSQTVQPVELSEPIAAPSPSEVRVSVTAEAAPTQNATTQTSESGTTKVESLSPSPPAAVPGLGLGGYSSDED